MQSPPPSTVVVLGTGGTISGSAASPDDNLGYVAGTVGVDALVAAVAGPSASGSRPSRSPSSTARTWISPPGGGSRNGSCHHAARPEVAGVVVTHGTDTLEETAYFLARVVAVAKPVVLTGAMRPATSREADGPRNLADAIAVAAQAARAGVVVAFAGVMHSARDVRKVHSSRLAAFSSGDAGVLGRLEAGRPRSDASVARGERPGPRAPARGKACLAVGGDRRQRGRGRWPRRPGC
jgi:L-asparaginase